MQYQSLLNIVRHKDVLVADVLSNTPLNIEFRRALTGPKWTSWIHLVERLMPVSRSNEEDLLKWRLTPAGTFSVKSMYLEYMNGHTPFLRKYLLEA